MRQGQIGYFVNEFLISIQTLDWLDLDMQKNKNMYIFQMGSLKKDGSSELQISVNGKNKTFVGWK